ncbi:MAG: hypothetical protein RBR08_15155 [Desulforegulaceae bacterium]|nr:hypothetical protein [Desulforegulaceae bacterium]
MQNVTKFNPANAPAHSVSDLSLTSGAVSVQEILNQMQLIKSLMTSVMKDGEHYGMVPGCGDKKVLLKPGAEKLMLVFRLLPEIEIRHTEMENGHREYEVTVSLFSSNGLRLGMGIGSCSTMETKYRFRTGEVTLTDRPVPREYWKERNPELLGGKGFVPKKNDNQKWVIAEAGEKVEHNNPADYYNTCLKMAKKRAMVDAVMTTTAASDIFTQDLEEDFGARQARAADEAAAAARPVTPTHEPPQDVSSDDILQTLRSLGVPYKDETDGLYVTVPRGNQAVFEFVSQNGFVRLGSTNSWRLNKA